MSNFISAVQNTLNSEYNHSVTENGALGYRTSGKSLLDLNFSVASLRHRTEEAIVELFMDAFFEDKLAALKWLFFARDVREGLGERRLFRAVIKHMANSLPEYVKPLVDLIPEYGRFDDLWELLDTPLKDYVMCVVSRQLNQDLRDAEENKPISLLAKWMPSIRGVSKETIRKAKIIAEGLGLTEKVYRKILSSLRRYLDVVETKMSDKRWDEIKYEAVPSRANLIYNSAFLRNDEARRREYLSKLEKGETKINAGTLYPHDIVHKYGGHKVGSSDYDATLENLWKSLPDTVNGCENTIVVADGSGSMTCRIANTEATALSVANALAIYFAERSSGQFRDRYITFSYRPKLVDLSTGKNLREKLMIALRHNEVANTNIEAVFDLILNTAKAHAMKQEDLPHNVLIISDMEFDGCAVSNNGYADKRLFEAISERYENAGYKIPRLIFWNVNSRTGTIPVKENNLGVALVSGFSPNIAKMVMSGQTSPYLCLMEALNSIRYAPIEERLRMVLEETV